jgi:hypothetical protein
MPKRYAVGFPPQPTAGVSGICIPEEHQEEIARLEAERKVRLWTVSAIISDHVPLAGELEEAIYRPLRHTLILNENPLTIYVSQNGRNAVYYDLKGGTDNRLSHIELRVETDLPERAIRLAWQPFSSLLDNIVRNHSLPLIISRLELLSPDSGEAIAYNLLLPNSSSLLMGPLGEIVLDPAFMAVDAVWREALVSSSPFYRLLCAYRMEAACLQMRTVMRSALKSRGLNVRLPPEYSVDAATLVGLGMPMADVTQLKTVRDLLAKFRPLRNAIAHFFIDDSVAWEKKVPTPISDGDAIRTYSIASSAVLYYVHLEIESLRIFFTQNNLQDSMRGTILPLPERKLDFPVRDPNLKRS